MANKYFPLATWTDRNNPNWEQELFSNSVQDVFTLKDFGIMSETCFGCPAPHDTENMTTFTRGSKHNPNHAIHARYSEYKQLCDDCATDYLIWCNYRELQNKIDSRIKREQAFTSFCQAWEASIDPLTKMIELARNERVELVTQQFIRFYNEHLAMYLATHGKSIHGQHDQFIAKYQLDL